MKKRLLALLLVVVMALSFVPLQALALPDGLTTGATPNPPNVARLGTARILAA